MPPPVSAGEGGENYELMNIITNNGVNVDNSYFRAVRTFEEVAVLMGVNERTVRRNEKSAFDKLERFLSKRGYGKQADE